MPCCVWWRSGWRGLARVGVRRRAVDRQGWLGLEGAATAGRGAAGMEWPGPDRRCAERMGWNVAESGRLDRRGPVWTRHGPARHGQAGVERIGTQGTGDVRMGMERRRWAGGEPQGQERIGGARSGWKALDAMERRRDHWLERSGAAWPGPERMCVEWPETIAAVRNWSQLN